MTTEQITALTTQFAPSQFVTILLGLATFIIAVIGVEIALNVVKGGTRKITRKTSRF